MGAHFFSDVIAGLFVSLIVYQIFEFLIKKNLLNKIQIIKKIKIKEGSIHLYFFIFFFIISIFLMKAPFLDVYFSNLFYVSNVQFVLQKFHIMTMLFREFLLPFLLIYILILSPFSKINFIKKIFFNYVFKVREILFLWLTSFISLIIIINYLLKDNWGRPRPNDTGVFGGDLLFTPWYKISDSCVSNCSFVSGDASVGFLMIVLFFVTKKIAYCYLAILFGCALGLIRIAEGGHFLSDVIISYVVMTASCLLCFLVFKRLYDK